MEDMLNSIREAFNGLVEPAREVLEQILDEIEKVMGALLGPLFQEALKNLAELAAQLQRLYAPERAERERAQRREQRARCDAGVREVLKLSVSRYSVRQPWRRARDII